MSAVASEISPTERRRRRFENLRAVLLTLGLPGFGHISLGYHLSGAVLFCLFVLALNGVFLGRVLLSRPSLVGTLQSFAGGVAGALWFLTFLHTLRISYGRNRPLLRARRAELTRTALIAYLRDELHEAHRLFSRAIRYDYDWEDPELFYHRGVVELRLAERAENSGDLGGAASWRRTARRSFRTCLVRDPALTWGKDILRECRRARIKPPRQAVVPLPADGDARREAALAEQSEGL